jgi:thioredoxin 2
MTTTAKASDPIVAAAAHAVVPCPFCFTLNRVALGRLDDRPKCADCGKPLLLDRPIKGLDDQLSKIINGASVPVLVDFYADWCGPCKMMAPILDDVSREQAGQLLVVKVNSDQNPVSPQSYQVRGIPTMVLFKNGQEVARQVGAVPKPALLKWLQSVP